jgi:FO synthase
VKTALESRLANASPAVARLLGDCLDGRELSAPDALSLFRTRGADLQAVLDAADELRARANGDLVTFVIVRNINFTNICHVGCRFCGFARKEGDAEAEFLPLSEIADRAAEAWERGATEVCIQGGLHPRINGNHYRDILVAIKERVPGMHIHAFSPFEIKYGAGKSRMTHRDFIAMLKEHGLGTIPGTAAEILDTEVRAQLTKDKLKAHEWIEIVRTAHELGMRTTSTMMYGHVDGPEHWVAHIETIRNIQKETGGFTEFVPLGFIHWDAPIFLDGKARSGPVRDEHLKVHAIARLMLRGWIDNIQVSWVKLGPRLGQYVLKHGANDFGGTLMEETISRSAGAPFGEEITPQEFCRLIREIGRTPARRNTLYDILEVYGDHDPGYYPPLKPRTARMLDLTGLTEDAQ